MRSALVDIGGAAHILGNIHANASTPLPKRPTAKIFIDQRPTRSKKRKTQAKAHDGTVVALDWERC